MVQALWYVRKSGQVSGPFPAPQIDEALRVGEIVPTDELSLDGEQWQPVRESGLFRGGHAVAKPPQENPDSAWQIEREKARHRWEDNASQDDSSGNRLIDSADMDALRVCQETTRAMVNAQAKRRPSVLIAIAAFVALGLVGGLVWLGQGDAPVQTGIGKASNCSDAPAPGISWAGCDKSGLSLTRADLHSMTLNGVRFDGATLAGANLSYVNLSHASLRGVNLAGANLLGANLDGADLTGADLSQAELRYATFVGARLDGVRLDGVSIGKTTWLGGQLCDRLEACR
jgi:hypothetical protein